jgi:hypothetical protein
MSKLGQLSGRQPGPRERPVHGQPAGGLPAFTIITTPTPVHRRALELLGVSHRLGHA